MKIVTDAITEDKTCTKGKVPFTITRSASTDTRVPQIKQFIGIISD